MNLFINAISQQGIILSFDENRQIIETLEINILWRESKDLGSIIDNFVKNNLWGYQNLKRIILVHGPGSFTGIRAIVLTINTIKFLFPHIQLTPLSYFSLFHKFPIIKASSKKDLFVQIEEKGSIVILKNEDFFALCEERKIEKIYGDELLGGILKFEKSPDYDTIVQEVKFEDVPMISPLYIKKPNIS